MEEIKNWLESENRDYHEGIKLLSKQTRNRQLLNNLMRKESDFNRKKLEYELEKAYTNGGGKIIVMVNSDGSLLGPDREALKQVLESHAGYSTRGITINTSGPAEEQPAPVITLPTPPASNPLDELVAEMTSAFNKRVQLSNSLADCATDEHRKLIVDAIDETQAHYNSLAEKKAYYEEHGSLPQAPVTAPAVEEVVDKGELLNKRNNLRSQKTKAKKAADEAPDNVEKQVKLAKVSAELQLVEDRLKFLG